MCAEDEDEEAAPHVSSDEGPAEAVESASASEEQAAEQKSPEPAAAAPPHSNGSAQSSGERFASFFGALQLGALHVMQQARHNFLTSQYCGHKLPC